MKRVLSLFIVLANAIIMFAQKMPSVAGVKYGTPYAEAKTILDKRFNGGENSYQSEKGQQLFYTGVRFANSYFDYVEFNFEAYNGMPVLNNVMFVSRFEITEAESAKKQRDYLKQTFEKKYDNRWGGIDEDGYKYYVLGYDPINPEDGLIVISTYKNKTKDGEQKLWTKVEYVTVHFSNPMDEL